MCDRHVILTRSFVGAKDSTRLSREFGYSRIHQQRTSTPTDKRTHGRTGKTIVLGHTKHRSNWLWVCIVLDLGSWCFQILPLNDADHGDVVVVFLHTCARTQPLVSLSHTYTQRETNTCHLLVMCECVYVRGVCQRRGSTRYVCRSL